jgi:uridine phosphorylase
MAIGKIASIPVLVVETQMGAPATQIILNEVLSDDLTANEYKVGRKRFNLSRKVVIRIGTAGGINCESVVKLKVGDVVNATHSIGATGAVMQSLLRLDVWQPEAYEAFCARWVDLGSDFTCTKGKHPRVECSSEVVEAIEAAGTKLSSDWFHAGGNITKDSLYAELSSDIFLDLCRNENCRTTDMELSAIAVAAREHNTNFGMISAIVGMLPGSSFAEDEKMQQLGERRAIQVGLQSVKGLI